MAFEALSLVQEYYPRIDAGDVLWVVDLFDEQAVYDRASEIHRGRAAIQLFYSSHRKIKVTHSDLNFWQSGNDVFVEGHFDGVGDDGSARGGDFSDHWTFNKAGKVILRRTSLFTGSAAIRE